MQCSISCFCLYVVFNHLFSGELVGYRKYKALVVVVVGDVSHVTGCRVAKVSLRIAATGVPETAIYTTKQLLEHQKQQSTQQNSHWSTRNSNLYNKTKSKRLVQQ